MKYIAEFKYGTPSLIAFEVEKETDKSIIPAERTGTAILGWSNYVGRRINKGDNMVFDSIGEALTWLIERAEQKITVAREELARAEKTATALRIILQDKSAAAATEPPTAGQQ